MIGFLRGRLAAKHPPVLLLDVGGVGYEIEAPMSTFYGLPAAGTDITLHTHLVVREDAHILFGFGTERERSLFRELIRISGVGPRIALGILSGAVAGLVAITPASGFVGPLGSLAIGAAAGIVCYWGVTGLKHMLGYDDALDAFGVHGVGGITGALLTGVFAVEAYGGTAGLLEGNVAQLLNQIYGVAIVLVYGAVVSLIILKLIDMLIGLRVTREVEQEGLDLALHGEAVQ